MSVKSRLFAFLLCFIVILPAVAQDKVIKILAIGNSFSDDAIEHYLYDLAKSNNIHVIIGNMYIGGAPVSLHLKNIKENNANYEYRKIGLDGNKTNTKKVSIEQAIQDESWDYISLQQASSLSGQLNVIMEALPELVELVQAKKPKDAKLIFHQTWAYQQDSKHKGFANYNNSQVEMYNDIVNASKQIHKSKMFNFVIPAGTAIQNARSSSLGDTFTRDGYHLQLGYGRFTAACAWYEKIFQKDVRKNNYKPENLTETQAKIAKIAAHKAVKSPWKVSKINL